jgi:hypothetical protein
MLLEFAIAASLPRLLLPIKMAVQTLEIPALRIFESSTASRSSSVVKDWTQ